MIIIIFLIYNTIVVVDDSRYMSVGNSSSTQFVTGIKKKFLVGINYWAARTSSSNSGASPALK